MENPAQGREEGKTDGTTQNESLRTVPKNSKAQEGKDMRTIIVAKDGSGEYTRIQEAVDAVPEGTGEPVQILVKAGEYREKLIIHRDGIRLTGEGPEKTVIAFPSGPGSRKESCFSAVDPVRG